MNYSMNRTGMIQTGVICACFAFGSALLGAQQADTQNSQQSQQNQQTQYEGVSHPPSDDVITTPPPDQQAPPPSTPIAKPSPSVLMTAPATTPQPAPATAPAQSSQDQYNQNQPSGQNQYNGQDNGTVQIAPPQPALAARSNGVDPDGDIVHPAPLPPGTLEQGTEIRVRLLTELSSSRSEKGDAFRARVDVDVLQDGQVLIPAGSEIDGRVVEASSGHFGGHGTLRLRPESVILPNGSRYMLVARVEDTQDSNTSVNNEGTIEAGSRYKRDGIEYGGGVGAGVVTGAVLGGPVGALAGGLIGAGAVTVHLLVDHPQATLEPGAVLLFTLSNRLSLVAPNSMGN